MTQGVVKSTSEAIETITSMKNTINGGLIDAITTLVNHGNSLNTEIFDGPLAAQFYAEWPDTRTALNDAVTRLNMMSDDVMQVNTNIQAAGGNG